MHEIWTHKMSYGLVAPFFIMFIIFSLLPLIASLALSFCYWNILESPVFTGWQNYRYLFVDDSLFLKAFSNTLYYAIIVGPVAYIMSYFFAWFINQVPGKIRPIYTLAFYAPSLTSSIAMSVVWAVMFSNDSTGYLNSLLLKLNIISDPVQWTQDVNWIMPVGIIVALWSSLGTGFLSFVAGFTNVDKELYDAAAVDGVTSRFQRLLYVDIPQTMPQLLFAAVLQITGALSVGGDTSARRLVLISSVDCISIVVLDGDAPSAVRASMENEPSDISDLHFPEQHLYSALSLSSGDRLHRSSLRC